MPLTGGTPISLAEETEVSQLYVSGSNLYWTQIYDPYNGVGDLESVPTAGGATVTLIGPQNYNQIVAVDDTQVYYWEWIDDASVTALTRIPLLGGHSPTSPLGMKTSPYALDATNVYWVDGGGVWKCPKGSSCESPTYLGGPGNDSGLLAIDAESVYWTVWYGAILKTPLAGGPVTTLVSSAAPAATGGYGPFGGRIAVDDTSIYWSTQGAILKAPK